MTKTLIAFPKIRQYRQVIRTVKMLTKEINANSTDQQNDELPSLKFKGTIKLHGTNAGIIKSTSEDGDTHFYCQSRNEVLDYPHRDNAGFAQWISQIPDVIDELFETFKEIPNLALFGEWCGKGIQKGVGISALDKMFVIFAIQHFHLDDQKSTWIDVDTSLLTKFNQHQIFHIDQFQTFEVEIDFNSPGLVQNHLAHITENVEKEEANVGPLSKLSWNGAQAYRRPRAYPPARGS